MQPPTERSPRQAPPLRDSPNVLEFTLVGAGALLRYCATEMSRRGHRVIAVFTDDGSTAESITAEFGVPVQSVDILCSSQVQTTCDVLLSVGNLRKLPVNVLSDARVAAVNYHDGPLPRYPGLNAPSWALISGESEHGMTWHMMTGSVDAGPILAQRRFRVETDDTSFTLGARCYEAAIDSFPELLDRLEQGDFPKHAEALDNRTRHLARPSLFGLLDWSNSAENLTDLARALDFGPYANPLGFPKLLIGDDVFIARKVERGTANAEVIPGHVSAIEGDAWLVDCRSGAVKVSGLCTLDGTALSASELARATGTAPGTLLPTPTARQRDSWEALSRRVAQHEGFWTSRLLTSQGPDLPGSLTLRPSGTSSRQRARVPEDLVPQLGNNHETDDHPGIYLAALVATLASPSKRSDGFFDIAYRDEVIAVAHSGEPWGSAYVPLRVCTKRDTTFSALWTQLANEVHRAGQHQTFAADLPLRFPVTTRASKATVPSWARVAFDRCESLARHVPQSAAWLTLIVTGEGVFWEADENTLASPELARLESQLVRLLREAETDWDVVLGAIEAEATLRESVQLSSSNDCIHTMIEQVAGRQPDRDAVHAYDGSLTYSGLESRSNQLARYLLRRGLRPEDRVAICLDRSLDMVVAVLAVLKAGGCYVPVDPTYPRERTSFMVADSQASFILANAATRSALPSSDTPVVSLDLDSSAIDLEESGAIDLTTSPSSLAYLIYTSGSSGQPKGVMLEHRNVGSFFKAMDQCLDGESGGTWLAVTSLSFDISVLELLWTLSRGFTVVVGEGIGQVPSPQRASGASVEFSLFYFSSDAGAGDSERYRLLLEGARFADKQGFSAVWTPERHFHSFGGLYPNPAVTAAAIAAITERIDIRAGSVVMPLHHPARVAEEWAVVDNISNGRVGVSFAAGWQPNDFILRPENFVDNKSRMLEGIDTVRALWRGESRVFPGPDNRKVEVQTLPRPIQPELPTWLTAAGNPETFKIAGESGFRLLTHLLGQSIEDLATKIAVYRSAWKAAGHSGEGHVTLMLHTFVDEDDDVAREKVREPLKDYLRTSVGLIKDFASSFPALKKRPDGREPDFESLTAEELEALLDYSFERYYASSGLLGTPGKCREIVQHLSALGVNEIACLIDFGVDTDATLTSLRLLNDLRAEFALPTSARQAAFDGSSVAQLIQRYFVTHMQCTPSLARILLEDEDTRQALTALHTLLIGGEALPVTPGQELVSLAGGRVMNMYGPTEATVWSTVHEVTGLEKTMPIGRPLANTSVFIVDEAGRPAPPGVAGELLVGGHGVARGYHARPELTSERFIKDDSSGLSDSRLYRTGDRAVSLPDGSLEFLGRMDQQIKVRGHRVELGEIEARLSQHPEIRECAVTADQAEDGNVAIVGHVVPASPSIDSRDLRAYLRRSLPNVMVPSRFVTLDALPHTPNGKIDRNALMHRNPSPAPAVTAGFPAAKVPLLHLEEWITDIWREVLGVPSVGVQDNFFELGGHSLSAVHVHGKLKALTVRPVAITDLFRFPTIRTLATFIGGDADEQHGASSGQARAQARKQALARRRAIG